MNPKPTAVFLEIENYIKQLQPAFITQERKTSLRPLVDFIQIKVLNQEPINLNFICTHNSRRSHLSQVWAQTMAHYFNVNHVQCYSAGTEATALFPMVASTLEKQGFQIQKRSDNSNPVYSLTYAANQPPVLMFSKKLDNAFNPQDGFAAIMTCDSAMEACPIIPGAVARIPIIYQDPKGADNTPEQAATYEARSMQIATELLYIFSKIQN